MYNARVPKFEIDSKLPVVKSCTCPSELPGIELKGSVVPINGAASGSAMCETEGLCHFDYNIFYVGGIKLTWYSR